MGIRVPGASSLSEYWENLLKKKVTITKTFSSPSSHSSPPSPSSPSSPSRPSLVGGTVEGAEWWDCERWGVGGLEAAVMDPQHRYCLIQTS